MHMRERAVFKSAALRAYTQIREWTIRTVRPRFLFGSTGDSMMKRGRTATAWLMTGAALSLAGCGNGGNSSSELASNEPMTISTATPTPARQRGMMVAGDSLGQALFATESTTVVTVPDRDR